jgi:hypothetical protein
LQLFIKPACRSISGAAVAAGREDASTLVTFDVVVEGLGRVVGAAQVLDVGRVVVVRVPVDVIAVKIPPGAPGVGTPGTGTHGTGTGVTVCGVVAAAVGGWTVGVDARALHLQVDVAQAGPVAGQAGAS